MDVIISLWSKTIPLKATMTSMVTKNKVISSIMKSAIEKKIQVCNIHENKILSMFY